MVGIVGLTKRGYWGRWNQVLATGETKPCSIIWTVMPDRIRSYWLWERHWKKEP